MFLEGMPEPEYTSVFDAQVDVVLVPCREEVCGACRASFRNLGISKGRFFGFHWI